jgi:hypothetical protein
VTPISVISVKTIIAIVTHPHIKSEVDRIKVRETIRKRTRREADRYQFKFRIVGKLRHTFRGDNEFETVQTKFLVPWKICAKEERRGIQKVNFKRDVIYERPHF